MIDLKWLETLEDSVGIYLNNLNINNYEYMPALQNLTSNGENLRLGFSCFSLKINYILGTWDKLQDTEKKKWVNYINSFQSINKKFPEHSYLDDTLIKNYSTKKIKTFFIDSVKTTMNLLPQYKFEKNQIKLLKAVNAETKQAISTLHQVGERNQKKVGNIFQTDLTVDDYLNKFDWARPWNAGAQFSSLCVYSTTQGYEIKDDLISFANMMVDKETGSYFSKLPQDSREIINGAMKVITGLDWINEQIHYPEKLIDYCISNKPILEGCDVVDYVYVLFKCSQQTNYRKKEINIILIDQLVELKKLFVEKEGGFSYFLNKSQTHYYGVEIIKSKNQADLHGTMLSIWAISMIIRNLEDESINFHWNMLKP